MSFPVSFEFFPTKTPEGAAKHVGVRQALYARKPEFCSVTYGAGGSTQAGTFTMVRDIQNEGVGAASHFSCIGATHEKVRAELNELKAMGVKRIVALRGDLPSGYGLGGEFQYASDLVASCARSSATGFTSKWPPILKLTPKQSPLAAIWTHLLLKCALVQIPPSRNTSTMPTHTCALSMR